MVDPSDKDDASSSKNDKESGVDIFKKQQLFLILWSISEAKDGLTGYDIQKLHPIPRSTVYRFLNDLEHDGLIESTKIEHAGRMQKRYQINEKGSKVLVEIRDAIAGSITFMYGIVSNVAHGGITGPRDAAMLSDLPMAVESLGEDMVKALGSGSLLPVPPMLSSLLDYSLFQSILQGGENRATMLSRLQEAKAFTLKVLGVHEQMLAEIRSRLSLLESVHDALSNAPEHDFEEEKIECLRMIDETKK
jgi:DNA-binding PadR family transcriptional regulator